MQVYILHHWFLSVLNIESKYCFYQQYFQLKYLWICELKRKEDFPGIYHCIPIYSHIVHIGERKHILLHFQKLSLRDAVENTCGKAAFLSKLLAVIIIKGFPLFLENDLFFLSNIAYSKTCISLWNNMWTSRNSQLEVFLKCLQNL